MRSVYDATFYASTDPIQDKVVGRQYTYDQLNRIKTSNMQLGTGSGTIAWTASANGDQATAYTYDGNGNLLTLNRNGNTPTNQGSGYNKLDKLTYNYIGGTNQLKDVVDGVPGTTGLAADVAED